MFLETMISLNKEEGKQMKKIAMLLAVGCAVSMLTGCGVPQEDHDAVLAELNAKMAEIEDLKGKNTDLDSLLNAEKAKVRTARIELDDATTRIKGLQQKEAQTASALADEKAKVAGLEGDLSSAKSATLTAQDETQAVEEELAQLKEEHKKLKGRFDQFEKNMNALNQAQEPASAPKAAASPKSDAEAAMDLLNQMSIQ
jgi:chromosome segregation ATPase